MKNDIIIVKTFIGIGYNFKGRKYVIKQDLEQCKNLWKIYRMNGRKTYVNKQL
jgi:uncharacterized protein YlzI (FlbEa/FlbD family)